MFVVESHLHIIQYAQLLKQPDILKCPRHASFADVDGFLPRDILSVQKNLAAVRLIHACQQVEYCCLPRTVRSDETVQLFLFDRYVKCVHRPETAE